MSKHLTLITLLMLTATLFSAAHTRKLHLHRNARHANIGFHTDSSASIVADSLLDFAQSLIGTRYRSRSSDPLTGFDCSGFVSYVFKKFNFDVPRSSRDFIDIGQKIKLEDARPGDIILFTGTKKHSHKIGHVAIVYSNENEDLKFIHSTSGKEHGVTITNMDKMYKRRFVQVIRLI